ncbi:hypothetical protein CHGG_05435 [Chaetomium globosum CBS 148.51]|uniref:Protein kinase domain-containing protein n=1 Tax=Chaetomium globosum (strain ATCC 6205 / CBS 148.51 / DSM 1962 / NBRC 6347 / NRRL 1970) TaxID=306901 RepID=Q2H7D0_CHAGB|nr:uncharacterized protein CHGG_05435 [Chaetomium globosum CBS 148.51]EAQ88816.1 hypothetical protein CHGG_05435 [Chaetomium globosum CBS 148.51]
MSPVMDVMVRTETGAELRAVLKVYDCRLGRDLRECLGKHVPHTAAVEAAFQSFVKAKKITPFLRELARSHLQGESIPRMLAHVRVIVPVPKLPSEMSKYFELKGVLVERISGYSLADLGTSPLAPSDPKKWPAIVQSAVNLAHTLDATGVLMGDCAPRNVIVDKRTHKPFFIDFAQADFKDVLLREWHDPRDKNFHPEYEYWKAVAAGNNPGAIGAEMKSKLKRAKNMELQGIVYPDYESILAEILRSKKAKGKRPG